MYKVDTHIVPVLRYRRVNGSTIIVTINTDITTAAAAVVFVVFVVVVAVVVDELVVVFKFVVLVITGAV
jgi:hypothetical protein